MPPPIQSSNANSPYRVEYAVRVWRQLFELPAETIAQLGRELEALAATLATEASSDGPLVPREVELANLTISHEVSHARRVVTVLELRRGARTE